MGEAQGTEFGWEIANALPEAIALLDDEGRVVAGNSAWLSAFNSSHSSIAQQHEEGAGFGLPPPAKSREEHSGEIAEPVESVGRAQLNAGANAKGRQARHSVKEKSLGIGSLYLELCAVAGKKAGLPLPSRRGVEAILRGFFEGKGQTGRIAHEYSRNEKGGRKWYSVTFSSSSDGRGVVASHGPSRHRGELDEARNTQALFNTVLRESRDGVFLCDAQENIVLANGALCRWMGKESAEIAGRPVSRLAIFEMDRILLDGNATVQRTGRTTHYELSVFTARGIRTFLVVKAAHRVGGRIMGVVGVAQDITEERAMEREIIEISDKEKQRIGQELHENLCQYLVGISLLSNVLYEDLVRLQLKQGRDARQITALVKDAISEVRALAKGLAPLPQEHGEELNGALQELAEQARSIGKVRCTLRVSPEVDSIDPDTALHLFRIAQEAVHNAIKHAEASRINISLLKMKKGIVLKVQDDGRGMEKRAFPGRIGEMGSGLGLYMMKYRSRAIAAVLEFGPRKPKGTVVTCTVPDGEVAIG